MPAQAGSAYGRERSEATEAQEHIALCGTRFGGVAYLGDPKEAADPTWQASINRDVAGAARAVGGAAGIGYG